jgi:hypothetical protein
VGHPIFTRLFGIYSSWGWGSLETLGMSVLPAMSGEVCGDAGGEEADGDREGADDPGELDPSFEHEVIEDAEDEDEDGCLCKEGRATTAGDEDQFKPAVGRLLLGVCGFSLRVREMNAGAAEWGGTLVVKHKTPLSYLLQGWQRTRGKSNQFTVNLTK